MQAIKWTEKQNYAKHLSISELCFAIADCQDTIRILGEGDQIGKDANYYRDEISIYREEIRRREALAAAICARDTVAVCRALAAPMAASGEAKGKKMR